MNRIALVLLAAGIALAVCAVAFAELETRGHALSHAIPSTVAALLAVGVSRLRRARVIRAALLALLLIVSATQIAEGIGSWGWDEYQVIEERPWLTIVHDVALTGPAVALAAAVVTAVVTTVRLRRTTV